MGHYRDRDVEVDVEKDIDVEIDVDLEYDFDVDLDKDVDVDVYVDSDADIDGNVATLEGTVEAIGDDTLAELTFTVTTVEDQLSEVSVIAVSAVG
jgi:hypothetical protein